MAEQALQRAGAAKSNRRNTVANEIIPTLLDAQACILRAPTRRRLCLQKYQTFDAQTSLNGLQKMLGRLGVSARIVLRPLPVSALFRAPAKSIGIQLAPFSNVPAEGSGSNGLPTPWAPKHPNLGKTPQDMVRHTLLRSANL